jgi:hypothetical protein
MRIVDDLLEAYLDLYTRHLRVTQRPRAAEVVVSRWVPVLARMEPDYWDATGQRALEELIGLVKLVDDPELQFAWLGEFPSAMSSYTTKPLPSFAGIDVVTPRAEPNRAVSSFADDDFGELPVEAPRRKQRELVAAGPMPGAAD